MSSKSRAAKLGALWRGSGSPASEGGTADSDQLFCLDQRIPPPGPVPRDPGASAPSGPLVLGVVRG